MNLGLASSSLLLSHSENSVSPGPEAYGRVYPAKIPAGSPCSNLRFLLPPVLQPLLGQRCVYAERKAAGKSSCSLLLTCARPPQLSTSSAIFCKLGDFIVQRVQTTFWYEPHALSSPQHKSMKKIVTVKLGSVLFWIGNCLRPVIVT